MKAARLAPLFLIATTMQAKADIGGAHYGCWTSSDASSLCAHKVYDFNQNGFYGRQQVRMTKLPSGDSSDRPFRLSFELELNDHFNVFAPDGAVAAQVRVHAFWFHRQEEPFVVSQPVTLSRDYGTRVLRGQWSVDLKNNFGAEYVELARTLEILLPGQAPIRISLED